jgi:hypothetical protein
MKPECKHEELLFQDLGSRKIVVRNDAETTSSDAGLLVLREIDHNRKIMERFAKCFRDYRTPWKILHSLVDMLRQRIFGICQGYEDLNDHEEWRKDPMLAIACEKDLGDRLAGKSTLNRMELPVVNEKDERYKKIICDQEKVRDLLIDLFLESYRKEPKEIIIDIDATNDPVHGEQEGRFFHGYYDEFCFLPFYAFVGEHILMAELNTADEDPGKLAYGPLRYLYFRIRDRWPNVRIVIRGDGGFCRERIMSFCDEYEIQYVFGMPGNKRLKRTIGREMHKAKKEYEKTGEPQRIFKDLKYKTAKTWSRFRRVVAKAEHLSNGANPRFVVTNLDAEKWQAQSLYEDLYCARGNMENRIKEQKLFCFSDRTSTHYLRSNQLRLFFSALAYVFFVDLRLRLLAGTEWSNARIDTLRLKLLKVSAWIVVSRRRVLVRIPTSFPYWDVWIASSVNLKAA